MMQVPGMDELEASIARAMGEIGPGNGWAFASGDTLKVSGAGDRYRALTLRVP